MSKCIESRAISWLSRERTKATRSFDNALKRSAPADDLVNLINKNEILEYLLKLSVDAFVSSDVDAEISFDIPKTNETDEMCHKSCIDCKHSTLINDGDRIWVDCPRRDGRCCDHDMWQCRDMEG